MRAEVEALRATLAPLAMKVYWQSVPPTETPSFPYLLLWQSTGRPFDEVPLDGRNEAWSAILGLTAVGTTTESAREKATLAKRLLTPGGYPLELPVVGRSVEVQWSSFGSAGEDRDANLPGVGFPQFYVDLYRLTSLPV